MWRSWATNFEFLSELQEVGSLREPVLIAAFVGRDGYNTSAAATLGYLLSVHNGKLVAEFDPEPFYDFTVARPTIRLDGERRMVDWPTNRIYLLSPQESRRDMLVLVGVEPQLKWRTFAETLEGFVASINGVRDLVILRSWPAPLPHTRPVLLRLTADDKALADQLGLLAMPRNYEGPIDFSELLCARHGGPDQAAAGLTVLVPNYLGVVPSPSAIVALTEVIDRLAGCRTPLEWLRAQSEKVRESADEALERSAEMGEVVRQMEEEYSSLTDSLAGTYLKPAKETASLVANEELIEDIERFLKQDGHAH